MKHLFSLIFSKRTYWKLIALAFSLSLAFSIACQLEMLALGIITKRGPDFFELFAPKVNGKLVTTRNITYDELQKRWNELDQTTKGVVTVEDTQKFLSQTKKLGVVDKVVIFISHYVPIDKSVGWLVVALLFVAFFKATTLLFYRLTTNSIMITISRDVRQNYFEHIQTLPMSFFQDHNIGSIASRVTTDAIMIADGVNSTLVNYFQTPFTLISAIAVCLLISWKLSLTVFIALPLLVLPIFFLAKRIRRLSKQIQKRQEAFTSVLVEFLSGIQTIKAFGKEAFSYVKYSKHNEEMADLELRSARYDVSARPILHTIGAFCLVTALLVGLYGLHLELHEVLFFCGVLTTVYEPIKKFADENGRIQRGIAACQRFETILLAPSSDTERDGPQSTVHFEHELCFNDVSFAYDQEPVLKHVTFRIKKGQKIAICGPTGAGKSSIVTLLPRLYDPVSGSITLDGHPLTDYKLKALRQAIGFVPQRPFLFNDTVLENIRFGQDCTREDVIKAAKNAHADEFISKLEHGYDTILAEAGKSLSGGQQQRIAIARALVKNSPILVLDEATSSLDTVSEHYIRETLETLHGKVTLIIVAHRLSTIEDADCILYIREGQLIAQGTKEELLASSPDFLRMWQLYTSKNTGDSS